MLIHVLGCAGAELPGLRMPAFAVNESTLLDAGTIGMALPFEEQLKIKDIFITHAHLDHIKAIPFFADNVVTRNSDHQVTVHAIGEVIDILRGDLFNGRVWPDFTQIPDADSAVISFNSLTPGEPVKVNGLAVTAVPVNHPTPAAAFHVVHDDGTALIYTGDTGPTEDIWRYCDGSVDGLIVEVSFPNEMNERALVSGHLTPELLAAELVKMKQVPDHLYITHAKPSYREKIGLQVSAAMSDSVEFLTDGQSIELFDSFNS
jgi:cAMP phosphodiesterase